MNTATRKTPINQTRFYERLKTVNLPKLKSLKQSQVNGLKAIFAAWDAKREYTDVRWLSYILATTYHEVDGTMQPIEEYGKGQGRPYGRKLKMAKDRKGNRIPYTTPNKLYYGRGFVQLTWFENYELMGRLLGLDLLKKPELALELNNAVDIMFEGMTKGYSNFGDFTGRSLEVYFNANTDDPINARRVINGVDKARLIAGHHAEFLQCLL
jgi:hypothetical protein